MIVRLGTVEDSEQIANCLHDAFNEFQSLYTPAAFAATAPPADQLRRRLAEGPVWVAEQLCSVIGTASTVHKGTDLYIRGVAVIPSARGLGVGRQLLREIEVHGTETRATRLLLSTAPFLTAAIALYESVGFIRTGEEEDLFGTALFLMAKALGPSAL